MATIIKRPYGFQLCVTHKLLPKKLRATFDTREAAEQYGRQLEGLLAQGIVPAALLERDQPRNEIWTVHRCVAEYLRHNPVPLSDQKLLKAVMPRLEKLGAAGQCRTAATTWLR